MSRGIFKTKNAQKPLAFFMFSHDNTWLTHWQDKRYMVILSMNSEYSRRFAARLVFYIGLLLMLLGTTFLLASLEGTSWISVFLAFLVVLAGVICAVLAIRLNKRSSYLFFASFFLMAGIYLFLSAMGIIPLPFSRAWPLLSVFSGLSLLPVGWRRYGGFRTSYFVPSCALVILGCVLMIFALRVIPYSFRSFMLTWWPMFFVLAGITLVLSSLSGKNIPRPPRQESEE